MSIAVFVELITTVGFPIACVLAMGFFIYKIYKNTTKQHTDTMAQLQARCAEREDRLYKEIAENRAVNEKAIETLAKYAERLGVIEQDVKEIKEDIIQLAAINTQ